MSTKKQRVQDVLALKVPDRIPVMMHNFLPSAREAGYSMKEFRSSSDHIFESMKRSCEKYDLDGIFLDMDTAILSGACGADVKFPDDIAAVTMDRQSRSIQELIEYLPTVDLEKNDRVMIYLEAVEKLARWSCENDVFLRANADQGPYSLACELVGMNEFLVDLLDEDLEDDIHELIRQTYRISLQMHKLCSAAGADATSYGNSSEGCSVVSPSVFREFGKPYEIQLAKDLNDLGITTICHICGNVNPILPDFAEIGCKAYEIDARTDLRMAKDISKGHFAISGNIDPALISEASPDKIVPVVEEILNLYRNEGGLILCSGCALSSFTPEENIKAIVQAVREFG